jgi:hypothetical protein
MCNRLSTPGNASQGGAGRARTNDLTNPESEIVSDSPESIQIRAWSDAASSMTRMMQGLLTVGVYSALVASARLLAPKFMAMLVMRGSLQRGPVHPVGYAMLMRKVDDAALMAADSVQPATCPLPQSTASCDPAAHPHSSAARFASNCSIAMHYLRGQMQAH